MPTVAELSVDVDADDRATATLEEIDALLRRLAGSEVEAVINADADDARQDIEWVQDALFDIANDDVEATITIGTEEARARVEELKEELRSIAEDVDLGIDLDKAEASARVEEIRAELESLSDAHANVDLDTGEAFTQIMELRVALAAIPDERVTVEVDTDTDRLKNITSAASRASTQVSALAMAILLLGPAIAPLGAVLIGMMGAMNAALVAASAGAILFGAVAMTNFGDVADALKKLETYQKAYNTAVTDKQKEAALEKMKALMASLSEPERMMVEGIQKFKAAWSDFAKEFQPQIFKLAAQGMGLMADLLPSLSVLMRSMLIAGQELMSSLEDAFDNPAVRSFGREISLLAGPIFTDLMRAVGNVILGMMGITQAFFPMASGFSSGLVDLTAKFAAWGQGLANNPGFKAFISYVQQTMPMVIDFVQALWKALVSFAVAMAPWGGVILQAVTGVLNGIAALSSFSPLMVSIMLAVIGIGAAFLNLAGPVLAFISVFSRLGMLLGIAGGWIALIVAAIIALVVGVIYAYTHFETFRNIVNGAFQAVQSAVQAAIPYIVAAFQQLLQWGQQAWSWLVSTFGPAVSTVIAFVVAEFDKIVAWFNANQGTISAAWQNILVVVRAVWAIIVSVVTTAVNFVVTLIQNIWGGLVNIVQGIWTAISSLISGWLQVIRGIITAVMGLIAGDWDAVWRGLGDVVQGMWTAVWGIIRGAGEVILGILQVFWGALKTLWSSIWNTLVDELKPIIDAIAAVWQWLYDFLIGNSIIPDLVNGVIQWFSQLVAYLLAVWAPVQAAAETAWTIIKTVITTAIEIVSTVIKATLDIIKAIWRGDWDQVGQIASAAWEKIKGLVSSAVSTIWNAIKTFIGNVLGDWGKFFTDMIAKVVAGAKDIVQKFGDLGRDILAKIKGIAGDLLEAGKSLMRSLADGVMAGAKWVQDAVGDAVDKAKSLLPGSPAEEGPFSGQGYTLLRGQRMMADFAQGIRDSIPDVVGAMKLATGAANVSLSPTAAVGGTGGTAVQVASGAVVIQLGSGVDPTQARRALGDAGSQLATQIETRLKRTRR